MEIVSHVVLIIANFVLQQILVVLVYRVILYHQELVILVPQPIVSFVNQMMCAPDVDNPTHYIVGLVYPVIRLIVSCARQLMYAIDV